MSKEKRFKFIINPEAGRGKTRKIEAVLRGILGKRNIDFEIEMTQKAFDAVDIAKRSAATFDVVVAVGGDGTANEVANGVIGSSASMGVIPSGSGNDFAALLGMDNDLEKSVDQIILAKTQKIDSGTVHLEDSTRKRTSRRFVNSIGIGFDAIVAYESQKIKSLKGIPLYLLSIFRSLRRLKPHLFQVICNGKSENEHYYLVCVGNGNREGGGFYVTPSADPSDGMFEVCTLTQVSLLKALRILPTILKGAHGKFAEVRFTRTRQISVGSGKPFIVHCDGEVLGVENSLAEIEMHPKSLSVVVGEKGLQRAT